jgi:hypothetical protein
MEKLNLQLSNKLKNFIHNHVILQNEISVDALKLYSESYFNFEQNDAVYNELDDEFNDETLRESIERLRNARFA